MPEPMPPADVPEHYAELGREALEATLPSTPDVVALVDADDLARAVLAPVLSEVATAMRVRRGIHQSAEDDVDAWKCRAQQAEATLARLRTMHAPTAQGCMECDHVGVTGPCDTWKALEHAPAAERH